MFENVFCAVWITMTTVGDGLFLLDAAICK